MRMIVRLKAGTALGLCLWGMAAVAAPPDDSGRDRFLSIYREIVETDSSPTTGSCTAVAEKARARLLSAGFPAETTEIVLGPNLPLDGNLIAQLPGSDPSAPAILLLAHIDVVPAKASDWKRDPYKLIEENGFFYARGSVDDKAMASILVDTLARMKEQKKVPRHTLKLALTCGEESQGRLRGVRYLIDHRPDAVKSEFALNEGGNGYLDETGKPLTFMIEAGQKATQDFKLTGTSPGAHSSRPTKDNLITRFAEALVKIGHYHFTTVISPVTRDFFKLSAQQRAGQVAADMRAIGSGSNDPVVIERLADADPVWNAMMRTTCVATIMQAGAAKAALAQSGEINVNCRILPGQTSAEVKQILTDLVADPSIGIDYNSPLLDGITAPTPPMPEKLRHTIDTVAGEMWPGVPVIPGLQTGASDGRFLDGAGIPTYGVTGLFVEPDGNGVHGLDERVRIKSLLDARTFLYRLITKVSS